MIDDLSVLLKSGYKFSFAGAEILEWNDPRPQPSPEEIPALSATLRKAQEDQEAAAKPRRDRATAYIKELSEEGDFQNTVGDLLDALIKWTDGDKAQLDAMKTKINAIKSRFPKTQ